jgi:hypothetical protein
MLKRKQFKKNRKNSVKLGDAILHASNTNVITKVRVRFICPKRLASQAAHDLRTVREKTNGREKKHFERKFFFFLYTITAVLSFSLSSLIFYINSIAIQISFWYIQVRNKNAFSLCLFFFLK